MHSIITVKLSKQNDQSINKLSTLIQDPIVNI